MTLEPAPVFSVANLWEMIEDRLAPLMTARFRLRGTLQDIAVRRHLYCSLVDRANGATGAKVNTVIFASDLVRIRAELAQRGFGDLESDVEVVAVGRLSTYRPSGRVSFVVDELDYDEMRRLGRLDVERIRQALIEEGIFGANKQQVLSAVPLRIAIVTSQAGTVQHDFTRVLVRSGLNFSWQLFSTRVTGAQAAEELAQVVRRADEGEFDLIVIVRGGGSESELALFNTEPVVRSVATARTPVWCAIGHAADDVLLNEVAHRALDVPQSVATALVDRVGDYLVAMDTKLERVVALVEARLRAEELLQRAMAAKVISACHSGLTQLQVAQAEQWASVGRLIEGRCHREAEVVRQNRLELRSSLRLRLANERPRLPDRAGLRRLIVRRLADDEATIGQSKAWLQARDPRTQLQAGYAILQALDGRWLTSVEDVGRERYVSALMSDGSVALQGQIKESE